MNKLLDNDGDLITLDINIVGDPDWLSQDYALCGPTVGTSPTLQDGSINFTKQQLFDFMFASPGSDYNDSSGLFGVDSNYAEFSGRYQVISVVSSFVNGSFTQKLEASRLRNQNPTVSGTARADQGSSTTIGSVGSGGSSSGGGNGTYWSYPTTLPGYGGSASGRNVLIAGIAGAAGGAAGSLINDLFTKSSAGGKNGNTADATVIAPNTDTNSKTDPKTGAAVPENTGYVGDGSTVVKGTQGYVGDGGTSSLSKTQGYIGDGSNDPKVIDTTTIGNGGYNPNEPVSAAGKTFINDQGQLESLETPTATATAWAQTPYSRGDGEDAVDYI